MKITFKTFLFLLALLMGTLYSCNSDRYHSEKYKRDSAPLLPNDSIHLPGAKHVPRFFKLTHRDFAVENSNYLKGERLYYNSDSTSIVRAEYDIYIYVKHPHVRQEMKSCRYTAVTDSSLIMTVKRNNVIGVLELLDHSCDARVSFQFIED